MSANTLADRLEADGRDELTQDEAAALRQPPAVESPQRGQEIRPVERPGEEVRGHVRALCRLAGLDAGRVDARVLEEVLA